MKAIDSLLKVLGVPTLDRDVFDDLVERVEVLRKLKDDD